MTHRIVKQDYT